MARVFAMEGAMRIAVFLAAASIAATDVAAEIERAEICSKESDQRTIEVATPGTVGAVTEVVAALARGVRTARAVAAE